jgi:peptidoglycan/LPS O-acetylase OafA/YrhL
MARTSHHRLRARTLHTELPQLLQPRFAYIPAIDGLRALAVVAVLLYHADVTWMPGGFVGVDIFFVISGYLITGLLLGEWERTNRLDLHAFWLRRAYRLVPAMIALLVVTLIGVALFLPDEVARTRAGALAGLLYISNWHLIFHNQSYFDLTDRPPLLRHLWSLAVEGQMYILWPLLLSWLLPHGRRLALFAAIVGALSSAALIAILFQPDVDPSHVYYGTDTRAFGLLAGAILALAPRRMRAARSASGPLDLLAIGAIAALIYASATLDEFQPLTYQLGLAAVVTFSALLLGSVVSGRARFTEWLLSLAPLRWLGLRSYSIYLWHWPIYAVTRPQLDLQYDAVTVLAIRFVATLICAELSYRLIERPIRRRASRALAEQPGQRTLQRQTALLASGLCLVALSLGATTLLPQNGGTASASEVAAPAEQSIYLAATAVVPTPRPTSAQLDNLPGRIVLATPTPMPTPTATHGTLDPATEAPSAPSVPTLAPTPLQPLEQQSTLVVGDSVMVGTARELQAALAGRTLEIDAAVGRQMKTAIELLRERRDAGQLGSTVIIHIGNNSPISTRQFDDMMSLLTDVPHVIIINLKVPRRWQDPNNDILAAGVSRYPNAQLLDWHAASVSHPEFFRRDGLHLLPPGQRFLASLIVEAMQNAS